MIDYDELQRSYESFDSWTRRRAAREDRPWLWHLWIAQPWIDVEWVESSIAEVFL